MLDDTIRNVVLLDSIRVLVTRLTNISEEKNAETRATTTTAFFRVLEICRVVIQVCIGINPIVNYLENLVKRIGSPRSLFGITSEV